MFISIYMSFVASGPTGKIDELWCSKHSLRKPMPSSQLGLSSEKYIPTKRCIFVCWLYTVRTGFSTRAWIKSWAIDTLNLPLGFEIIYSNVILNYMRALAHQSRKLRLEASINIWKVISNHLSLSSSAVAVYGKLFLRSPVSQSMASILLSFLEIAFPAPAPGEQPSPLSDCQTAGKVLNPWHEVTGPPLLKEALEVNGSSDVIFHFLCPFQPFFIFPFVDLCFAFTCSWVLPLWGTVSIT